MISIVLQFEFFKLYIKSGCQLKWCHTDYGQMGRIMVTFYFSKLLFFFNNVPVYNNFLKILIIIPGKCYIYFFNNILLILVYFFLVSRNV